MNKTFLSMIIVALTGLLFLTVTALIAADKPSDMEKSPSMPKPSAVMKPLPTPPVPQKPGVSANTAMKTADVPDDILIENKGYKKEKKGPVKLSHHKHAVDYKIACTECHHVYENGKNVWKEGMPVKKCIACHDPVEKKGDVDKLQNAFHKNCKTCHKALAKEKKKAGPYKKCNKCHEKK